MAVHHAVERGVLTLTLDAQHNRNALSADLVEQVHDGLRTAADTDSVRAVVITHAGPVFCSGADLKEQAAEGGPEQGTRRLLGLLRAIVELGKPVIAALDGHARAGGVGVVGACDMALAGPASTFAFTEVRLGLAPAVISLCTLGRMSERSAARYFLTGETFDAASAAAAGLVTTACDDLTGELATVCDALRACSPQGLAATKPLTTAGVRAALDADATAMQQLSQRLFASDEAREGMTAFLEKRPPRWTAG